MAEREAVIDFTVPYYDLVGITNFAVVFAIFETSTNVYYRCDGLLDSPISMMTA